MTTHTDNDPKMSATILATRLRDLEEKVQLEVLKLGSIHKALVELSAQAWVDALPEQESKEVQS